MENNSKSNLITKIEHASQININLIYPHIFQLLGYRQRIAQELLKTDKQHQEFNSLMEIYDYTNNELKSLLSL